LIEATKVSCNVVTTSEVVSSRARTIYRIYVKNWGTQLAFNPAEDIGMRNRSRRKDESAIISTLSAPLKFAIDSHQVQMALGKQRSQKTNPFGTTGRVSGNDYNFQEGVSLESEVN
jgi:hypothetical protein